MKIAEWFGHPVNVWSPTASADRTSERCPYLNSACTKTFNDGTRSGVCSVTLKDAEPPIVICPNRLYAENYGVLAMAAELAFGAGHHLMHPDDMKKVNPDGRYVVAFGKRFGKELKLPRHEGRGGYFVDWILARISAAGTLAEFVAVEVQSIDTTGTYRPQVMELRKGVRTVAQSKANLNWENVNKRILPQLIYKGHVLRRERLCTKGLFFVCPTEVYERIVGRLGGKLMSYPTLHPGTITFMYHGLGSIVGEAMPLVLQGQFTTTIDQVALAFTAPANLPPENVYEEAIRRELE